MHKMVGQNAPEWNTSQQVFYNINCSLHKCRQLTMCLKFVFQMEKYIPKIVYLCPSCCHEKYCRQLELGFLENLSEI